VLREEQVAVLCDIAQSIAFADGMKGEVERLIREGYVSKEGDLYELTPKAEKIFPDAALVSTRPNQADDEGGHALVPLGSLSRATAIRTTC
jgi:hypothetical protein